MEHTAQVIDGMSIACGIPLSEEPDTGALTLGGFIREVCARYGPERSGGPAYR